MKSHYRIANPYIQYRRIANPPELGSKNDSAHFVCPQREAPAKGKPQWKTNPTSDISSRQNWPAVGLPSRGWPGNWAARGRTPTRSSAASGSILTYCSKSATCWITISSSAIRIGGMRGKKSEFCWEMRCIRKKL